MLATLNSEPVLFAGLLGAVLALYVWNTQRKSISFPPYAPGRLPVIGHLHQFVGPTTLQELFRQWSLKVGPIFTVQFGGKHWIILNSMEAVKQLIVDRSAIYSSRELQDTLVNDLMGGVAEGGGFAFFPYGKEWRYLRRVAHNGLVKRKIDSYQPIIDGRRDAFLFNIWKAARDIDGPITLDYFTQHYTMTTILTIAFGSLCSFKPGDPELHAVFSLTEKTAELLGPDEQLREFFPILKLLLPKTRPKFLAVKEKIVDFYGGILEKFKESPPEEDCFFKQVLERKELTDFQIISFAAVLVGAGSDTTAITLEWMIAFLATHPEIQEKVYEEIKANVGQDRLPSHEDEYNLPYLQCVLMETLRLRPPAPLGVPHSASEDDVFQGWFIPKGTTVLINFHSIHMDPERYPDPTAFKPERHLAFVQKNFTHKISQTTEDRPHLSFSTGRRVCVGIHLAERSLFMAASGLLSCFKFVAEDGEIDVNKFKDIRSPSLAPAPYKVRVIARHENLSELFSKNSK